MKKVSTIFKEKPEKWGLRGDPYFWEYLEDIFNNYELPFEYEKLEKIIKDEHIKLTGIELTKDSIAKCEKFEHGGMSSGGLSGEFWTTTALPLLKEIKNKKSFFDKLFKK